MASVLQNLGGNVTLVKHLASAREALCLPFLTGVPLKTGGDEVDIGAELRARWASNPHEFLETVILVVTVLKRSVGSDLAPTTASRPLSPHWRCGLP